MRLLILSSILLFVTGSLPGKTANEWKAGVAKVQITPTNSIWLTGFAARTNASQGKLHELYVKALALEDNKGGKAVLITTTCSASLQPFRRVSPKLPRSDTACPAIGFCLIHRIRMERRGW